MSLLALLFFFLLNAYCCQSKILGGFVMPHGGIALNPSRFDTPDRWAKQWAWKIHKSSVQVGKYIRSLEPDLIFLSTPHGVADMSRFMLYMNQRANGSAETDNCQCPPCCYDVDVKLDANLTKKMVSYLADGLKYNVSGMSFFGPPGKGYEPSVLKWGEVIPLIFIKDFRKTKLLFLSQPYRRYDQSVQMIPELLRLGNSLYQFLEALPQKVAVVISADLAHTHSADGPYGFSPDAEPFDKNVGNWARTLHPSYLLTEAPRYEQNAESCGYTGLVMLHGLLDAGGLSSWTPVLHANYHPSYYGMMVASFTRKSDASKLDHVTDNRVDQYTPGNQMFG